MSAFRKINCRVCGKEFTQVAANNTTCQAPKCKARDHADRQLKYKARLKAQADRRKFLRNRQRKLSARMKYKLILIAVLCEQHAKDKHSQALLIPEQGATDSLDAIRRMSEGTGYGTSPAAPQ